MHDLSGKSVWITGAGSGIGEAIAKSLAAAGAQVALSARREEALQKVANEITSDGGKVETHPLDISNSDQVADAARNIQASLGKINVLINCAGMNSPKRHWRDLDIADWHRIVAVNLNGVANTVCATLPVMRAQKDGLIINIASWAAKHEFPVAGPAYVASKRGVVDLSHSINQEEMHNNIRCCCISPGEVATPILDQRPVPIKEDERALMLKPDDLADMVTYVVAAPARICFNEIIMSPTHNRTLLPQP
ncbi:SDR family oxidoreductase [Thalassospira xianhensis]|uniref:Oxidoreductase n=1 Tax=Thalassospira xianhensis MCCC 1A02616 TaxID=1177929 RepID=A0A367U615_9PROT|nr:SDR family oxidoreductase [Thalassospira xianhensis]RCK03638.1 oxidoreductase [Thalassospira xianhensis MCCC 1A02616]